MSDLTEAIEGLSDGQIRMLLAASSHADPDSNQAAAREKLEIELKRREAEIGGRKL